MDEIKFFNTTRTLTTLVFFSTLLILSGCNPTPSHSTKKVEMGSKQVQEPEPNLPLKLPTPTIQSESGISIPAIQGSYCWGGTCADYASLNFEDNTPIQVLAGEDLSIDMGIDIPPDEISISEYVDNRNQSITSTDVTFQLPKEPGIHYYGAFVRWTSPQDSQISLGDTSFTFVVRVVE
ncbi:hypothetical protein [Paenibacillus xylanexedens]|uniref:hypothetical protein n=1 Tax=Paenibacillus xylanexedens TaxID=528191 RepID=UPI003B0294FA